MKYKLILGSQSPRRQQLLRDLGYSFTTRVISTDEVFPQDMPTNQVAEYLAQEKGKAHIKSIATNELVITADTTVVLGQQVLNKPADLTEAKEMLRLLSGKAHQVISGVCLTTQQEQLSFSDTTTVYLSALSSDEIDYYVNTYQPLDKAGGYAIQEWIGKTGISRIEGSFYNVVGLPTEKLYQALKEYSL
ncbi:MAG: Maf family protein [Cyclobacteriaceae bacterium]